MYIYNQNQIVIVYGLSLSNISLNYDFIKNHNNNIIHLIFFISKYYQLLHFIYTKIFIHTSFLFTSLFIPSFLKL
jgi:hypothetical protein